MTSEAKRSALRERIEQAQARLAGRPPSELAREAAHEAIDFAKANPMVVIGAAAALGLALGAMSRGGRKAATATGVLSRIATDAAFAFALAMYERATERAEEDSDDVSPPQVPTNAIE